MHLSKPIEMPNWLQSSNRRPSILQCLNIALPKLVLISFAMLRLHPVKLQSKNLILPRLTLEKLQALKVQDSYSPLANTVVVKSVFSKAFSLTNATSMLFSTDRYKAKSRCSKPNVACIMLRTQMKFPSSVVTQESRSCRQSRESAYPLSGFSVSNRS